MLTQLVPTLSRIATAHSSSLQSRQVVPLVLVFVVVVIIIFP